MKCTWISCLLLVLFSTQASTTYACSCEAPGTPTEELALVDLVFSGTVARIDSLITHNGLEELRILFKVRRSWKGVDSTEVSVLTPLDPGFCGYPFRMGESYLVYAYEIDETGTFETILCSRTNVLSQAREDVEKLGKGTPVHVEEEEQPSAFLLASNYPNPFNPTTRIAYEIRRSTFVMLTVYDVLGRHIRTLVNGLQHSGAYTIDFDAEGLPSGMYVYELRVSEGKDRKIMMLTK